MRTEKDDRKEKQNKGEDKVRDLSPTFFPLPISLSLIVYFSSKSFKCAHPECIGEETRLTLSRASPVQLYLLRESLSQSLAADKCYEKDN